MENNAKCWSLATLTMLPGPCAQLKHLLMQNLWMAHGYHHVAVSQLAPWQVWGTPNTALGCTGNSAGKLIQAVQWGLPRTKYSHEYIREPRSSTKISWQQRINLPESVRRIISGCMQVCGRWQPGCSRWIVLSLSFITLAHRVVLLQYQLECRGQK